MFAGGQRMRELDTGDETTQRSQRGVSTGEAVTVQQGGAEEPRLTREVRHWWITWS